MTSGGVRTTDAGDGVVELMLDRPSKRNALTPEMLDELAAAIGAVAEDGSARCVLLGGEGRVFCAGFDLQACLDAGIGDGSEGTSEGGSERMLRALLSGLDRVIRAMLELPTPVVIAAHGAAIAGGCALLAAGDVVISDADARLGYPVLRLGISPAVSAPSLIGLVGHATARERVLLPSTVRGSEALSLGLVHELAPSRDRVLQLARAAAADFASKPPGAMAATRRWLRSIEHGTGTSDEAAGLKVSLGLVGSTEQRTMLQRWGAERES